ncbi:hypothetical protein HMPREF3034_01867 [Prevotella sp. DNF00663]|uniref:DUF4199 domain-containing protein n=1 Tax=unclassified Prevotella TaxID=2638335 RepID=UPI0005141C3D|nr:MULTISPECIES: DUF4199 domain-containing protein [unclassified Prevotella]KGI61101.1 hypothetical protein HMPREF0671_02370 [Prevotella sp. S7 MS 2]KXB81480.1 hypothetical protein HMPREF3034_01867 [Prevotella sp. DNF00663]
MINIRSILQMQAFARLDGVYLAILWIVSFLSTIYLPEIGIGGFLVLFTPFFVGWRLTKFRDYALDGIIPLGRAILYCMDVFFCGAFIFSAFQFFYLSLVDDGQFTSMLTSTAILMDTITGSKGHEYTKAISFYTQMSPLSLTSIFMIDEIILGFIVTPVIALFCFRRTKKNIIKH